MCRFLIVSFAVLNHETIFLTVLDPIISPRRWTFRFRSHEPDIL
jgi:hypothetical protein